MWYVGHVYACIFVLFQATETPMDIPGDLEHILGAEEDVEEQTPEIQGTYL